MTATLHPPRRGRIAGGLLVALALAGLPPSAVRAAPRAEGPPLILGATLDPATSTLTVRGRHFGPGLPTVRLAGVALQGISSDDGTVLARLPAGAVPGRRLIEVIRPDGVSAARAVTLRPSRATPPRASGLPAIETATGLGLVAVTIRGRNLGVRPPALALNGQRLQLLTFDGTNLTARLGPRVAPGTYVLTVTTEAGASASTRITLTR